MSKYCAYPEYKASGVEWLGEIPKSWAVKKLKYICSVGTGTKDTVNAVEDGVYPFFVRSQTVERINSLGADCEAVLTAGDGVGVGKVFHYYNGKFDYHQRVYMLNNFRQALGRFVYYYLSNNFYKVALEGSAKSTVDSLRMPQFLNFEFSLPELEVQQGIVLFLDHETAKIDTLIEKQQQLIQLLKEKRQAVISHAVTKGLSSFSGGPNAKLRDSGVEWLGDVPEHWRVTKFHYEIDLLEGPGILAYDFHEEGVPLLRIHNVKDYFVSSDFKTYLSPSKVLQKWNHFRVQLGDLIISCSASTGLVSEVGQDTIGTIPYTGLIRLRPKSQSMCKNYIRHLVQSDMFFEQINKLQTGSTIQHFGPAHLQQMYITLPLPEEQHEIAEAIDSKLSVLDCLTSKAEDQIALMQERRTALISAAVTGKIDVRDWVAPQASPTHKEVAA